MLLGIALFTLSAVPAHAEEDEELQHALVELESAGLLLHGADDLIGIHALINLDAADAHPGWSDVRSVLEDHPMAKELEAMHGAIEAMELAAFHLSLVEVLPGPTGQSPSKDPRDNTGLPDGPLIPGLSYDGIDSQTGDTDLPPPPDGRGDWVNGTDRYGNRTHYRTTHWGMGAEFYATDPKTGAVRYEGTIWWGENETVRQDRSHDTLPDGRTVHKTTTTTLDEDGDVIRTETEVIVNPAPSGDGKEDGGGDEEATSGIDDYQPAEGGGGAVFCPMSVAWCQLVAERILKSTSDPYRILEGSALILPGSPEGTYPKAPPLLFDPDDLVTDPSLWEATMKGEPPPVDLDEPAYPHDYALLMLEIPGPIYDSILD